jgi:predicted nucleic acid-binding protein
VNGNRRFVDTGILVYAHDASAGGKRERARALVQRLWETGDGCVSVQVLQELFTAVTRRVPKPLDTATAEEVVADLARWHLHVPTSEDVLGAIGLHRQTGISFRDAMVIRSAVGIGCEVLCSEELEHGQVYDGVRVENPFTDPTGD